MIAGLTALLGFQLAGEVIARTSGLPLSGPVIGMASMLVALVAVPQLAAAVGPVARVLLANLSLLFVPAGVGVVGHLDRLGQDGMAVATAILGSTALSIAVGAGAFVLVARWTGSRDD